MHRTYLHIVMARLLDSVSVSLKRHLVDLLHPEVILFENTVQCGHTNGSNVSEYVLVCNDCILDLTEGQNVVSQHHVD